MSCRKALVGATSAAKQMSSNPRNVTRHASKRRQRKKGKVLCKAGQEKNRSWKRCPVQKTLERTSWKGCHGLLPILQWYKKGTFAQVGAHIGDRVSGTLNIEFSDRYYVHQKSSLATSIGCLWPTKKAIESSIGCGLSWYSLVIDMNWAKRRALLCLTSTWSYLISINFFLSNLKSFKMNLVHSRLKRFFHFNLP